MLFQIFTTFSRGGAGSGTQTLGPRNAGIKISADFSDLVILAKQLSGNGPIPRKIINAAERATARSARKGRVRLRANVNNNADAFRDPNWPRYFRTRGKRIRPYALNSPSPLPRSLASKNWLVSRLGGNMRETVEIEVEPRVPGQTKAGVKVGWDTNTAGFYIEAVLLGTRKMRARPVLRETFLEIEQDACTIFRKELGLVQLFVPGDRSLTFVGFNATFESLLTGDF